MHTYSKQQSTSLQHSTVEGTYFLMQTFRAQEVQRLASLGYWIIPVWGVRSDGTCCCTLGSYCTKPGKHTFGRKSVTLKTLVDVQKFWAQNPESNYGILHGVHNHPEFVPLCLDFDLYKDSQAFSNFESKFGQLPPTAFHRSARGGLHLFFKVRRNFFSKWIDGVSEGKKQIHIHAHGIDHVDLLFSSGNNGYSIGPGCARRTSDEAIGFQYYSADQNYSLGNIEELADLPASLAAELVQYLENKALKNEEMFFGERPEQPTLIADISVEIRLQLADMWLKVGQRSLSIQGSNGNKAMLDAMNVLTRGFGIDPVNCLRLMDTWNRLYARPAWSNTELNKAAEKSWRGISGRKMGFMLESESWKARAVELSASMQTSTPAPRRKKYRIQEHISFTFIQLMNKGRITSEDLSHLPASSKEKVLTGLRHALEVRGMSLKATRWGNSYVWTINKPSS